MTEETFTDGDGNEIHPARDSQEFPVGTRVRSTRAFSGVPTGTEGVVDEDYGEGLMVAWDLPDKPLPEGYDRLPEDVLRPMTTGPDGFEVPLLRDGFDKSTELHFLERVEEEDTNP